MNEDCSQITCPVPNNQVQDYLNQYSLNGVIVRNTSYTTIINGIPVTIPSGTFEIPLPPNPPQNGFDLSYQGCQSLVVVHVPAGATQSQIEALAQQLMQEVAAQQAVCDSESSPIPPPPTYKNDEISTACSGYSAVSIVGSPTIPVGITYSDWKFTIASGIFTSDISKSVADSRALSFLLNFITTNVANGNLQCGWTNIEQIVNCPCGVGEITVAAGTYFSSVSLADANQQAIDNACPTVYYNSEQSYTCCDGTNDTIPAGTYCSIVSQAAADAPASSAIAAFKAACKPTPVANFVWDAPDITNPEKSSVTNSAAGGNATASVDYTSSDSTSNGYTILTLSVSHICNDNPKSYHVELSGNISAYSSSPVDSGRIRLSTNNINPVYESRPDSGVISFSGNITLQPGDAIYLTLIVSHAATHVDATLTITDV